MTKSDFDPHLTRILEDCLEAIQSGRATIQDCLERYPDEAPLIRHELHVALMMARLKAPTLTESSVSKIESRIRAHAKQTPKTAVRPARRVIPLFAGKWAAAFVLAFLMALGTGGGTVAASANSLPGETLYSVKRAWENVILLLATLAGRADDIWLHLSRVRFEEMLQLVEKGDISNEMIEDFSRALLQSIQTADADSTVHLVGFMTDAESQLQVHEASLESLPDYERMMTLLKPLYNAAGYLQARDYEPILPTPESVILTSTPEPSATWTLTAIPTNTPSLTPEPTVIEPVATSRFPATATRTPEILPSETPILTATFTASPTLTYTPLPLGERMTATPVTQSAGQGIIQVTATPNASENGVIYMRETQSSVYATQTAIAGGTARPTVTPRQ